MSIPENQQNERLRNSNPWIKIELRANLKKKSKCPALPKCKQNCVVLIPDEEYLITNVMFMFFDEE